MSEIERLDAAWCMETYGWTEAEALDNLALAAEARAQFGHIQREPLWGDSGVRVYIMADARDFYKVGISNNPTRRAHALSAGNPTKVSALYATRPYSRGFAMAVEAAVHDHLAGASMGREWFQCPIVSVISAVQLMSAEL